MRCRLPPLPPYYGLSLVAEFAYHIVELFTLIGELPAEPFIKSVLDLDSEVVGQYIRNPFTKLPGSCSMTILSVSSVEVSGSLSSSSLPILLLVAMSSGNLTVIDP